MESCCQNLSPQVAVAAEGLGGFLEVLTMMAGRQPAVVDCIQTCRAVGALGVLPTDCRDL